MVVRCGGVVFVGDREYAYFLFKLVVSSFVLLLLDISLAGCLDWLHAWNRNEL